MPLDSLGFSLRDSKGFHMQLTIAGCGDAFGSGGRLQTCYHVAHADGEFLIDCGATAIIGLNRAGLDPNRVSTIFISHLHGDHFAGLVWWLLHAQHVGKRTTPLTIVGPEGIEARYVAASETLFSGSTKVERRFALQFVELIKEQRLEATGVLVTPYEVSHPSGAPSYALRFEVEGKVLSFSGDTEWVETLIPTAKGADLFIAECYAYDKPARYHMGWKVIEANIERLAARRILITHMNADMLAKREMVRHSSVVIAEDGMQLVV